VAQKLLAVKMSWHGAAIRLWLTGNGRYGEWATLLLGVLYLLRTFNLKPLLGDEGVATMGAWRIASGQVPGRDFFEIIPPFSFLPTAVAFRLLGVSVVAERLVAFVWGCALLLLIAALLRRFVHGDWARAAGLCLFIPFGAGCWPIPSHHWAVVVLQLAALWALDRSAENGGERHWAALSGVLAALACFTLQDQGFYLVAALTLLYFPLLPAEIKKNRLFISWAGAGLSVVAIFAAWLLPRVSLAEIFNQWVAFPAQAYKSMLGNQSNLFAGWSTVAFQWKWSVFSSQPIYTISITVVEAFIWSLPALGLLSIGLAWRRKWLPSSRIGLLLAGELAFAGGCAHRWAMSNLTWAAAASLIPVMVAMERGMAAESPWIRRASKCACAAIGICALSVGLIFFRYAALRYNAPIVSPAGTLRSSDFALAKHIQQAVLAIDRSVPPSDGLISSGFTPLISFLSLRYNPTPYNFLWYPEYNSRGQIDSVMATLEKSRRVWVLLSRPLRPATPFEQFVARNYRAVWSNEMFVLMAPVFSEQPALPKPEPPLGPRNK
jgi:hypothetical protein